MIVDSGFKVVLDTLGQDEGKYNVSEEVLTSLKGQTNFYSDDKDLFIVFAQPIYNTYSSDQVGSREVIGVLIVSASNDSIFEWEDTLTAKSGLVFIIAACLLVPISFILSSILVRPLKNVIQSLDHAAGGNLEDEIMVSSYKETQAICDSYNQTLSRLKILDDTRQEFVSNVSHELKTPITSIRVLADSLIAQEDAPVELYQEFMQDISDEIDRENRIIEDLLELIRLDKSAKDLNVTQVNMNDFLESLLKRLRPIAKVRDIELILESYRPVIAEVDEVKLTLALSNIIENAIKYNKDGGWVKVTLNADHKFFYVKIADSGVGIPEDSKKQVFDRFYRVDKARSRDTGGTGLGLAITQNIVYLHNGGIKLYSIEGEGTTFTVRIPLMFIR